MAFHTFTTVIVAATELGTLHPGLLSRGLPAVWLRLAVQLSVGEHLCSCRGELCSASDLAPSLSPQGPGMTCGFKGGTQVQRGRVLPGSHTAVGTVRGKHRAVR